MLVINSFIIHVFSTNDYLRECKELTSEKLSHGREQSMWKVSLIQNETSRPNVDNSNNRILRGFNKSYILRVTHSVADF